MATPFTFAMDLSTLYGNSTVSTGLAGQTAGSVTASNVILSTNGQLALDNPLTSGIDFLRTYDEVAFYGWVKTTVVDSKVNGVAAPIPTSLSDTTPDVVTGSLLIDYDGYFNDFPLLGISGYGAGQLSIGYSFVPVAGSFTDILQLTVRDVSVSGWGGFEAALKALDGLDGNVNNRLQAVAYAGASDYSTGNFTLTSAVPEPASLALLGIGIAGLGFMRRRKA
ncbi:MAG: PEP-CTERM sorting domain-containing protein [Gammaproteobacteria bacterium]|nr:PEP-CTERM sorting domain-containing protein [Gammaproteobacteria bacterium]